MIKPSESQLTHADVCQELKFDDLTFIFNKLRVVDSALDVHDNITVGLLTFR